MSVETERRRVTKPPGERREDLLAAGLKIFAEKGVRDATVSDITRAAGVAKGTFYLYFDSKDQLVAALKEQMVDDILEHAGSLYQQVGRQDWWALVDTFAESYVDFMIEHRDMCQIMAQEGFSPESDPAFAECNRKIHEMLVTGLRAGMEAGVFATSDPELTSKLLHYAIEGTLVNALLYEPAVDRDRLATGIRELLHKTLAP